MSTGLEILAEELFKLKQLTLDLDFVKDKGELEARLKKVLGNSQEKFYS